VSQSKPVSRVDNRRTIGTKEKIEKNDSYRRIWNESDFRFYVRFYGPTDRFLRHGWQLEIG